ncbi:MAG: glycosyltransferase family 2 protein [Acidimicrobiales bacterium]|nr:glycosyltransferase family 2 protein [Acidimicrobiales bacterium]
MTEGDDNADHTDPFALEWPPDEGGIFGSADDEFDSVATIDGEPEPGLFDAGFSADPPQVHAIVVAEHAGATLTEVLLSLADQSYEPLVVTVLNATGDDLLPADHRRQLPAARWVEMPRESGFAALANWGLDNVDETESQFLLILDDSTALSPPAVTYLVEEMYRSNAGIVGPKLVAWNDPSKLLAVGYGADRRGRRIDLIEPDEFDQDQYSAVADVFVIPSGAQLIRTDLFKHLGGFDPVMRDENEDLDLCWRAHTVAARVIVVPQATARIFDPIPSRALQLDRYRQRARHRLRTLAVTTSRWGFLRAMVSAVVALVFGAIGNLVRLRPGYARAGLGAIPWNLRRWRGMRARRKELRAIRQVGDSEIHALQTRVGPSVGSLVEQSLRPTARLAEWTRSFRQSLVDERQRVGSTVAAFLGLAVLTIVLGTWGLVGDAPVVVGQNPILPDGGDLLAQWWSGYRMSGLGSIATSPLSFPILGMLALLFSWSPATLHTVLLVGPLVLGAVGTFRLVRPLGGPRAAAVATAVTVANPLTAGALAAARWETLVMWAFAPFILISAARLADLDPWRRVERPLPTRAVRFGALTAVVSSLAPAAVVVSLLAALSVAIFGFASGRLFRAVHGLVGLIAAVAVPAALNLRFTLDLIAGRRWEWLVGERSPEESIENFTDIVLFAPGRSNGSVLMWGLLAAASLGLLFGRKSRFEAAVFGWISAAVGFAMAWISSSGSDSLPGADALLTLAAAGMALAVGASVRSVQVDLKRYGYGWRQFAAVAAALGAAAVLLVGFGKALDGRHSHPEVGYAEITSLLGSESADGRILWLGDPRVLPADTSVSGQSGITFAITDGGQATIADRYLPRQAPIDNEVGAMLDVAIAGDTVRLGRLLAPFGIDYLIFQPQLAPAPYEGPSFPIDPALASALDDQLDLRRQPGTLNLLVFRNEASRGQAVALDPSFDQNIETVVELLDTDLTAAQPLVPQSRSATHLEFGAEPSLATGTPVLVSQPTDGWQPTGGAGELSETIGGLSLLRVDDPGLPFGVRYTPTGAWWAWGTAQLLLLFGAIVAASRRTADVEPTDDDEAILDLRSDRQIARELEREVFDREPVGDAL